MNTCDSCKWWGVTLGPRIRGQKRACTHIVDGEDNCNLEGVASVSAIHDGNFMSDLFTGPKFGCVHWEGKE